LFGFSGVYSQVDPSIANDYLKKKNYPMAVEEFKKLLKYDRENADWNFKLGFSMLHLNFDRKKSVFYLERAYKHEKHDKDVPYWLGIAKMLNYDYNDAKKYFEEYIAAPGKLADDAKKALKDCFTAEELMKSPVTVSFENLGPGINSPFPDYYPFITGDETRLAYTTRRKEKPAILEFDGYYTSDIFFSKYDGVKFSAGISAGKINSKYNEQCTGFTADGKTMTYYSDYIPAGELFYVDEESGRFDKKQKIKGVDEEKILESAAIISPDRNTVVYSSNRPGGQGGLDLYIIRLLPDNTWSPPRNLGTGINTKGDEDFPVFNPEGDKLFFSSNGHPGMGGFDVYEVEWNTESGEFGAVKNLGYPVNTPDHERSISFASDFKHAYMAADREGGQGDLDIYRLTFGDVDVKSALFLIKILKNSANEPAQADFFTIYDALDNIVGDYQPNPDTKVYTVILNPGTYRIEIEVDGELSTHELKVHEFMNRMGAIDKIIIIGAQP
jgi:hypothetical protein